MSELRQNLATKEWVIIAPERGKKPEAYKPAAAPKVAAEKDPNCPFCPGNEKQAAPATYVLGDEKSWKVRAIKNKYPALVESAPASKSEQKIYRSLPGEGIHEVIVDSPSHAKHPALLERRALVDLLGVYRRVFKDSVENEKINMTMLFKNHGTSAGTSVDHPHSQLIGSSVVPANVRHRMDEAQKYFDQNSACVFCRMIEEERRQGVRILADTDNFCAFVLYAALSPFHIWILPKRHTPGFGEITPKEIDDLAGLLQKLMKKIYVGLGDPSYNWVIQSTPLDRGTTDAFHWYLTLVVRVSGIAGFEMGSGMFVNTVLPEESAKFLNGVKA